MAARCSSRLVGFGLWAFARLQAVTRLDAPTTGELVARSHNTSLHACPRSIEYQT